MEQAREKGRRWVISTKDEMRRAAIDFAQEANRRLSIFTRDLEPGIYDDPDFSTWSNTWSCQKRMRGFAS